MEEIIKLLELISAGRCRPGFAYISPSDFILKNGTPFLNGFSDRKVPSGRPRMCFDNAFKLAKRFKLTYVEGYAMNIIPVHHAWCVDAEGKIIDNTWDGTRTAKDIPAAWTKSRNSHAYHRAMKPARGVAYFGVPIGIELVAQVRKESRTFSAIDDPNREWPLLKTPWVSTMLVAS